jgi:beta-phosphoglucomutase family hydrolase
MLGLPDSITTCLFDLDGVLTDTARVHRAAWAHAFDPVLARYGQSPFTEDDYTDYVDGKPRADGVRDLLAARGIDADEQQIAEIADRKNREVLTLIDTEGVEVFAGSFNYVSAAVHIGLLRVVVSSSANTEAVLRTTGLDAVMDGRIDGVIAAQRGLHGKPAPDTYLAGAELVEVPPEQAAVFEDATAGVEAGRRGGFGFVIGVNRLDGHHARALRDHGADVVVTDLGDLL